MKFFTPNPHVMTLLKDTALTTEKDVEQSVTLGIIAVKSTEFMENVATIIGHQALTVLVDWYKEYLGFFPHIATTVSESECTIKLVLEVDKDGLEGEYLSFYRTVEDRWYWATGRINYAFGVTSAKTKLRGIC